MRRLGLARIRWAVSVLTIVVGLGLAASASGQTPPAAENPFHLEDHLEAATVVGSEVPANLPQPIEWRFDEPQPEWKVAVPLDPSWKPLQAARTEDALRLSLTEATSRVLPWGRSVYGGVYVDLPDLKRGDWAYVIVRARTSAENPTVGVRFNLRKEAGPSVFEQVPFRVWGEYLNMVNDGSVQTYRLRADWSQPLFGEWEGPWQQLGLAFAASEPGSIDILSVRLVPKAERERQDPRSQSSFAGQTVSVNGMEMYYEIHGQGEPLVLLHGFLLSGASWAPFLDTFAAEYRVIVPDLRGHGRSTNPSNEFTHKQAALDVFALLDHLSVDEFQAMGISSGGMTLLHMATSQPERVDAMVLIGATSYFPHQDRAVKRATDPETHTEWEWWGMRQLHAHGDDQIRALWRQFRDFEDNYDDMNFTAPYLSTITARTLIVHGDRDEFFPVNIPVEEYEAIPNSYLWIVPNGDHVPIFGATTDYFTATTLAFLRGEWERQ